MTCVSRNRYLIYLLVIKKVRVDLILIPVVYSESRGVYAYRADRVPGDT